MLPMSVFVCDYDHNAPTHVLEKRPENIIVNDLNAVAKDFGSECYIDYCHFTKDAFERLGREIATNLRRLI